MPPDNFIFPDDSEKYPGLRTLLRSPDNSIMPIIIEISGAIDIWERLRTRLKTLCSIFEVIAKVDQKFAIGRETCRRWPAVLFTLCFQRWDQILRWLFVASRDLYKTERPTSLEINVKALEVLIFCRKNPLCPKNFLIFVQISFYLEKSKVFVMWHSVSDSIKKSCYVSLHFIT